MPMDAAEYDVGLVCLNGHSVNGNSRSSPEFNAKHCDKCGEPTIDRCPKCQTDIRGFCHIPGIVYCSWDVPEHCHECGAPYPWTQRKTESLAEVIEWLDELTDNEKDRLREAIPDVIHETPRTDTAVARFKKAIGKAGTAGGKLLTDAISKVAAEVVVQSLGIKH